MNVKVNQPQSQTQKQTSNQTNPTINQINAKVQPQTQNSQNSLSLEQLYQLLQQLQKQQNHQDDTEFIVKSHMKASFVALKVEQVLLLKKTAMVSAVGYAIPVALDSVFLIKKDLARMGKDVTISFELFEKQFRQKTVTGLRVTLKL